MPDPIEGAAGAALPAAATAVTPAAPAATPPASPAATPRAAPVGDPDWLPARLDRAKESAKAELLQSLGITDPAKAKAFIDAGIAAENDKKTLAEKLAEQTAQFTTTKAEAEQLRAVVALQANAQLSTLTAEQQAAVKAIAGDDPASQLRAVVALAPTWAAKVSTEPAPKPVTPPATTTPAPSAPAGATTSPTDHKAVFKQLESTNPFAAAQYAQKHPSVWSD